MKVVFLYTELADYTLACCKELAKNAEVHIVRWPVNKEAPFRFDLSGLYVYDKAAFDRASLLRKVREIAPDKIVCSGWIDKDYMYVVKHFYNRVPTIVAFDTHWRGDLKQMLATMLSPFFIRNRFSHAWVPGLKQKRYAEKLGFSDDRILTGFYSCDTGRFNAWYRQFLQKRSIFPKRFLFVGRYYEFKGVTTLWEAFGQLSEEERAGWELWCCGTGTVAPFGHPHIRHLGFVQPADMQAVIEATGVFVLPSYFEPWGVVVHEFAAAGYPLLLSREVGAAEAFLREGENGFSFESRNVQQLKEALKKIINLNDNELFLMAEKSHSVAQHINPAQWASTLLKTRL